MNLIPAGFGPRENKVRAQRWPIELARRVQAMGAEMDHDFTTMVLLLVRWAIAEQDKLDAAAADKKAAEAHAANAKRA